jgi:dolichol-phosphate mannosyltransferase
MSHILIMIPTYNEAGNIPSLIDRLLSLKHLDADILFIDDDSPDGTGKLLDSYSKIHNRITVLHRVYKAGIGTAHNYGIEWAYNHGYTHLVTMDGDFTHPPEDIPKLLAHSGDYDVVIGGRHAQKSSLEGWSPYRKLLTFIGHQFTLRLLHLPYDATSAFRVYRIDIIPLTTFCLIKSKSYSYFFESLCILNENKFTIYDVPVILPPRATGSSKLKFIDMVQCLLLVLKLGFQIQIKSKKLYDATINQNLTKKV